MKHQDLWRKTGYPDRVTVELGLEEDTAGRDADELLRHLETCLDCRTTLEHLAAEPAVWGEFAHGFFDASRQEPALRRMLERVKSEEILCAEEPPLHFLEQADRPNLLGLLGPYEVEEEIGRGGMGVVLRAVDPTLNRVVAIKVMSPFLATSAVARRRFTRESQAAAAVCHDHVVTVHAVGEIAGLPYLVMQYVSGESLQERIDRVGPLELLEVVRIALQTAQGLAAAHAQGLIHRDIKPANLLLEGGLARVKITDFGLARMADDVGLTENGVIAGTPQYMAPEQANGEAIDHRADLFSLGSVIHAMATGLPPFRGVTPLAVLRQVTDEEPAPLRSLNPEVPLWLEVFTRRMMAKDPAERFHSATEVALLLEGYLAHLRQPAAVPAPPLPPGPGQGEAKPDRASAIPGGIRLMLPVLGLLLALGIAVWQVQGMAEKSEPKAVVLAGQDTNTSQAANPPSWVIAVELLGLTVVLGLLGWLYLRRRGRTLEEGVAMVNHASASVTLPCPGCGKKVKAKTALAGKKVRCPGCGTAFTIPDAGAGTTAAGSTEPARGSVWIPAFLALLPLVLVITYLLIPRPVKDPRESHSFVGVPFGTEPVEGIEEDGLYGPEASAAAVWRWSNGQARFVVPLQKEDSPQGLMVNLEIHAPPGAETTTLRILLNSRPLYEEAVPRGMWQTTFNLDGIDLGEKVVLEIQSDTFTPQGQRRPDGSVSTDGRTLGIQIRGIQLLGPGHETPRGTVEARRALDPALAVWEGELANFACAGMFPDGRSLVVGCRDGTILIWDVPSNRETRRFPGVMPGVQSITVALNATFAVASGDGNVQVWGAISRKLYTQFRGPAGRVASLAWFLDSRHLAAAGGEPDGPGELKIWDIDTRKDRVQIAPFKSRLESLACAPSSRHVVAGGADGTTQVVNVETGQVMMKFSHPLKASCVASSWDNTKIAVAHGDRGLVRIHSLKKQTPLAEFSVPGEKAVVAMLFARDDRRLVTLGEDGSVRTWDIMWSPPRLVRTQTLEGKPTWCGLFYPDALPRVSGDGAIRILRLGPR